MKETLERWAEIKDLGNQGFSWLFIEQNVMYRKYPLHPYGNLWRDPTWEYAQEKYMFGINWIIFKIYRLIWKYEIFKPWRPK